jgi:hypothetical protein
LFAVTAPCVAAQTFTLSALFCEKRYQPIESFFALWASASDGHFDTPVTQATKRLKLKKIGVTLS